MIITHNGNIVNFNNQIVSFLNNEGYLYYRWQITNLRNTTFNSMVQASEFVFRLDGVDQSEITGSATITNPNGSNPPSEEPGNLIDGNLNTKWLDFNFSSNGNVSNIIFQFSSPQTFNGYRWATANDEVNRDPISWNLSASNNGIDWTQLHSVTNFNTTSDRNTYQTPQTY
jgi:hypothetical protein